MSSFVIGVGGTGAKCIESIVHLAACGLMPKDTIHVLFVDPDMSNGSLERAKLALATYNSCHKMNCGDTPIFQTEIVTSTGNEVWSPFTDTDVDTDKTLSALYNAASMKTELRSLFEVLFSEEERTESLTDGFLGHPSIGAAFMASIEALDKTEPWKKLIEELRGDAKSGAYPRVFFVGSIFGGTGASGVPTLARLVRNALGDLKDKVRISACMVLPYFRFEKPDGNMVADSGNFLLNTKAALQFYANQKDVKLFDSIYLLGDENQTKVTGPTKKGGKEQKNAPHFIELYAALAVRDALTLEDDVLGKSVKHHVLAREEKRLIRWSDLPDASDVRKMMGRFTRFAFAYRSMFIPMIEDIRSNGKPFRAPWYSTYIENPYERDDSGLNAITRYVDHFLRWFADIHRSGDQVDLDLIDWRAFAVPGSTTADEVELLDDNAIATSKIKGIVLQRDSTKEGENDGPKMQSVWNFVSGRTLRDKDAKGYGRFVRVVYDACSENAKTK